MQRQRFVEALRTLPVEVMWLLLSDYEFPNSHASNRGRMMLGKAAIPKNGKYSMFLGPGDKVLIYVVQKHIKQIMHVLQSAQFHVKKKLQIDE